MALTYDWCEKVLNGEQFRHFSRGGSCMVEQHISKHENTETLEEVQHSWAEPWSVAFAGAYSQDTTRILWILVSEFETLFVGAVEKHIVSRTIGYAPIQNVMAVCKVVCYDPYLRGDRSGSRAVWADSIFEAFVETFWGTLTQPIALHVTGICKTVLT